MYPSPLAIRYCSLPCTRPLTPSQANPKLSSRKDDDERLPVHWAASYNRLPIVDILADRRDFDVDAQVRSPDISNSSFIHCLRSHSLQPSRLTPLLHRMVQAGHAL